MASNGGTKTTDAGAQGFTCTVPAVKNAAGDATVRNAVTYFAHKADPTDGNTVGVDGTHFLSAESDDDSYKRWTASRRLTEAQTLQDAEIDAENLNSTKRSAAGVIAYRAGEKLAADWEQERMKAEKAFYQAMADYSTAAKAEAAQQHGDDTHAVAAADAGWSGNGLDATLAGAGVTEGAAGAAKALATAAAARDSNSSGSAWYMPNTRTQSVVADKEYETAWTNPTHTSLNAWLDLSNVATTKLHVWWQLASDFHEKVAAWHAAWPVG